MAYMHTKPTLQYIYPKNILNTGTGTYLQYLYKKFPYLKKFKYTVSQDFLPLFSRFLPI